MLLLHEITHYDFVQKVPCCEIDPEMNFLYVPKHTDMLTLIQGTAGISRVECIEAPSTNEWEVSKETHQKRFHQMLSMSPQASREYLLQELMSETTGIHVNHLSVLVDKMTFAGDIFPVNRHSMRKGDIGVFAKASFEETFTHFITAAVNGETDNTSGLSASIICGKNQCVELKFK